MVIMNRLLAILFAVAMAFAAYAADTRTQTFNSAFKTLQVCREDNEFFPPIINLDSDERIVVSFDELSADMRYMRYRIVHCDASWKPSQLVEAEYLDGFNECRIEDYEYSSATFANYVHYRFSLPNDEMHLTVSGNYLVEVYDEDAPDEVLLQARFMVCEGSLSVYPSVTTRTDVDYNESHQQLSVKVSSKTASMTRLDWYNDLKVVITQNMRQDNAVVLTSPNLTESNGVVYQHVPQLIFPAGNEYRRFEAVSVRYAGLNVENIVHYDPYYHVQLFTDRCRTGEPYLYDSTQFGRFKVRQSEVLDSDVNADYMIVHFALEAPMMTGGAYYIDGEFTHHLFDRSNRLQYNPATGLYERDMMLKMGSYNYQYLWVPSDSETGYTAPAEGDKYQTVNEYMALVYRRSPGERYDRLAGFGIIYSGR